MLVVSRPLRPPESTLLQIRSLVFAGRAALGGGVVCGPTRQAPRTILVSHWAKGTRRRPEVELMHLRRNAVG